jgi:nitrite reductase (NADH) large subunit
VSDDKPTELPEFHCYCTGVTRAKVVAAARQGKASVEELQREIGVCTGCRTCHPELEALLKALREQGKKT